MTGTSTGTRLQVFSMPDVGEGLTEAEVLGWRVAVGDTVTVNQVLVEIETAKAAVELPSPFAGRVHALLVEPGVTVEVGTPIISVDTDPGAGDLPDSSPPAASSEPAAAPANGSTDGEGSGTTTNGEGAKIGEVTADGRIATLVGYVSAGASTARRPRRGQRKTRRRRDFHGRAAARRRRSCAGVRRGTGRPCARWPPRRCASSPRTSASTWRQ